MKRILLLFSALMLSCIALWAHDVEINGIYYNLDETNKTAEVTHDSGDFYKYSGYVTIPETITYKSQTYSVTSIGWAAFDGCSGLYEVTIPNSVTSIGHRAFYGCSGLTEVTIPNSVTFIDSFAFNRCSELTSVTIGNSVTSIGSSAFEGTGIYNNNTNWDNGVLYIDNCLIKAKSDVVKGSYTIKKGTRIIGPSAFSGCSGLTSVTIPNSVTSIGSSVFYNCSGLTKVNYLGTVDKWVDIDFENSNSNPTYYGKDLYTNNELLTDVKITTADSIKNYAFYNCQSIKSVEIGNSVTSIGSYAFYYCNGLTSITIGNSVTSIGDDTFYNCSGLTEVTIPNSVTSIGEDTFYGTGFYNSESNWDNGVLYIDNCLIKAKSDVVKGSYTIKKGTRIIGSYAFSGCSGLTSVTIPNSVTSIGDWAFNSCSGLTSITIPNSVTSIGSYAFYYCNGLTSITIGNSVTSIGDDTFYNCSGLTSVIWNAKNYKDFEDYDETPFYNIRSRITSFTIGNEVEHIPAFLCMGMSNLKTITIPNSVISIGKQAFYNCKGLTSVSIGNSVTSIDNYAFKYCSGLTSITIPNSVTSIGKEAFYNCEGLTSVIWNAKNCKDFSSNSSSPFYNIRSSITSFTFDNEVEHIPAYLCYYMNNLKEVTIGKSVTSIGDDAFYNCSGLTSVTIPNSVTSIGWGAFYGCSGLTSVIWNAKNYKDFEDYDETPFYNIRSRITSFTFGNEVEHIPAYLCYGMSKLTEIAIPNSVTSIGSSVFYNCSGLTKVNYLGTVDKWVDIDFDDYDSNPTYYAKDLYINNELLADVKITTADSITNYAFYNCQSIKSVEIGNSVTSIGEDAFSGCSGLTKVNYLGTVDKWVEFDFDDYDSNPTYYAKDLYINNELLTDVKITTADSIKNYAFYNCQSIKSVEIGESVTSIGSSAFSGCDKLRKVTAYPTTVPSVYENSFAHYNAALYVPCDVYDDYFFDDVFGTFKITECIAAEEVDAPEKIEIEVDEDNNAIVIWPSTDGAKKYELEISKDGEVFCTLLFNENGQLTSIDFGNRSASVGFQFTVTGLDSASKYAYFMVAMDKKGNELQSYKGTFTTNGYVPGPGEEDEPTSITETLADANITISNGHITCPDTEFAIYNTIGQDVTAFNGSLQPGVYLVSIENNIVKVMVH